jgi:hypothetical protein
MAKLTSIVRIGNASGDEAPPSNQAIDKRAEHFAISAGRGVPTPKKFGLRVSR